MTKKSDLYRFHLVLISTAILFCFGFALFELFSAEKQEPAVRYGSGAFFVLGGVALTVYLRFLVRSRLR